MLTESAIAAFVAEQIAPRFPNGKQRSGSDWIEARCPEHKNGGEKKPSFAYHARTGGYCCQACGIKGGLKGLCEVLGIPSPFVTESRPREIVYDYTDADGSLLFQVCRLDGATRFVQRRPRRPDDDLTVLRAHEIKADAESVWSLTRLEPDPEATCRVCDGPHRVATVKRVPYRLPELLAADPAAPIFVVEGEKDVDNLRALKLTATCNPGGAGKWRDTHSEFLRDRAAVVLPDNDEPGRQHAAGVARSLTGIAASVRVLPLPGLPPKGDVSDWLASGGNREALATLVAATDEWAPASETQTTQTVTPNPTPHLTDLGNAQQLVAQHGADLRHCKARGGWLAWDGRRWLRDVTGEVMRRAKQTVLAMYAAVATIEPDDARAKFVAWARQSESQRSLGAMVKLAASEPGIAVTGEVWDAEPWLLNVMNGTLDLQTGTLRPHRREDLLTKLAPVTYEQGAEHPMWEKFLVDVTGGYADMSAFLQRLVGYTLVGDTREEVLVFLHGEAAAGKSTFIEAVKSILGDYGLTTDFETFLKRPTSGGPRNDLARLAGARFVASVEVEEGKALAESVVKTFTGGDTVAARFLYNEIFEFLPQFTLWLAANYAPEVRDDDDAMWRRILRVPFDYSVPEEERDPNIKATLRDPAKAGPAILAWAVAGCLGWQRDGLTIPTRVREATASYRADMDPLRDFISDTCTVAPAAWAPFKQLWRAYEDWSRENGDTSPLTRREFGERLTRRGHRAERGNGGKRIRRGIGLVTDTPEPECVAEVAVSDADSETSSQSGVYGESSQNHRHQPPQAPPSAAASSGSAPSNGES